jgi:2-isopropylmalate synthase
MLSKPVFPAASPGDFEAVSAIAKEIRKPIICALSHASEKAVDSAAAKRLNMLLIRVFISFCLLRKFIWCISSRRASRKLSKWRAQMLPALRKWCDDIEFSPMDASRTDPAYLYKLIEEVIKCGATTINVPDTVGYAIPSEFGDLIAGIFKNVPSVKKAVISVHCHNDLGMATANSLTAVRNGARQVECTINGIGERAGNAALEEVVMAIKTRGDFYNLTTGVDTTQIYKTSRLVSEMTGFHRAAEQGYCRRECIPA